MRNHKKAKEKSQESYQEVTIKKANKKSEESYQEVTKVVFHANIIQVYRIP